MVQRKTLTAVSRTINQLSARYAAENGELAQLVRTDQDLAAEIALHSRKHDHEVQFCAFDIVVEGGEDLRQMSLSMRKTNLERLLARRPEGIFVNPFERGEIGPDLFDAACRLGLEGLVSKRRDRPYRGGRSKDWVKVKNRSSPAMNRPRGCSGEHRFQVKRSSPKTDSTNEKPRIATGQAVTVDPALTAPRKDGAAIAKPH